MPYDRQDYALLDTFPSQIESDADLVQNRMKALKLDLQWREKHTDMDRCAELYHGNDDGEEQDGIPRVNKIQSAVDEHVSVALQNIPKVEMKAVRETARFENPLKQAVIKRAVEDSEQTINAMMREIFRSNGFRDEYEKALRQAGIYGVGYLVTDLDQTMDVREDSRLRKLMKKPMDQWTKRDAELYRVLSQRVSIYQADARDVVFEHGHRSYGDGDILRASVIERASTHALRTKYQNQDIKPGTFPYYVEEDPTADGDITAIVTTWELEPVFVEKTIERGGEEITTEFTTWKMVKTRIAGGQLVEKDVSDPFESRARLPVVPVYLRESEDHPYGDALPLRKEQSERFINLMRVIMYKSAKNSVSNQGALVDTTKLSPDDRQRVERVFDQGGAAALDNIPQNSSLEDIVMPLKMNSSLSSAPVEAMQNEERSFQEDTNTLDMQALNRSESGAAKRAQVQASDRTKSVANHNIKVSKKRVYDNVYELVQLTYGDDELPAMVRSPDGGRNQTSLNQEAEAEVPKMSSDGKTLASPERMSKKNPLGIIKESFKFKINDVTLPMVAETKAGGDLPGDPVNRFNLLLMYLQSGLITKEYMRELQLSDELKIGDDAYRTQAKQRQKALQRKKKQQMAAQQAAASGNQESAGRIASQQIPGEGQPGDPATESAQQGPPPQPQGQNIPGSVGGQGDGDGGDRAGEGLLALQSMEGANGPGAESGGPTPQERARDQR